MRELRKRDGSAGRLARARSGQLTRSATHGFDVERERRVLGGAFLIGYTLAILGLLVFARAWQSTFYLTIPASIIVLSMLISGTYIAFLAFRMLREEFVLERFQDAVRLANETTDSLRTFADYSSLLLNATSVEIGFGGKRFERIRDGVLEELESSQDIVPEPGPGELSRTVGRLAYSILWRKESEMPNGDAPARESNFWSRRVIILLRWLGADVGEAARATDVSCVFRLRLPLTPRQRTRAEVFLDSLLGQLSLRLDALEARRNVVDAEQNFLALNAQRDYELASLVHEINNTVQDIVLLSERANEVSGNDLQAQLKRIQVVARTMATTVSDLKRRRELECSEDIKPRERVDLVLIAKELAQFGEVRGERRRLKVSLELPKSIPSADGQLCVLVSAKEHLETSLRHLLDRALVYSTPGTSVEIKLTCSEDWVWLTMADTGPGFSAAEAKSLFQVQPYRGQLLANTVDHVLRSCRRLVEAFGGSFDVTSSGAGQGSIATLALPRARVQAEDAVTMRNGAAAHGWALVVDDEPLLGQSIGRISRALGVEPVIVTTVEAALKELNSRGMPRVLVADVHVGTENGLDVVRVVREHGPETAILVVTGQGEEVDDAAKLAGANDVIQKPIGQRTLFERIQTAIDKTDVRGK